MRIRQIEEETTIYKWYLNQAIVDLSPSYQRKADLWPIRNQSLLINSILNGYDIPKIYLADFSYGSNELQEKESLYAVIDGKQRLTTIFKFFADELELDATPIRIGNSEHNLVGARFSTLKTLHPELADKVQSHILVIMGVETNDPREINELFVRLNLNISISGPEIRNAMHGPIPQMIRNISLHGAIKERAKFTKSRGQDYNVIAKLLIIESGEPFLSLGKARLDKFVKDKAKSNYEDFSYIENAVLRNLDRMLLVFHDDDNLLSSQNHFSIYYNFIKSIDDALIYRVREFLAIFEEKRKEIARMIKSGQLTPEEASPENLPLISYNSVLRSPDNKSSIDLINNILINSFQIFVDKREIIVDHQE